MNLQRLFALQKELDLKIVSQHNLQEENLLQKKILALQVEIGELANETRCFKYWSDKEPSSKEVILEEYVDCLHFILSIGLEKNFVDINLEPKTVNSSLTEQFLNLYIDLNDFVICLSYDQYLTLFDDFISLGIALGFTDRDIENAYLEKNHKNHSRQENGY
ncbi:dUTP diphosphatase [Clostridium thermarum]|uniref:dUTP diphosphatase n=1 Tax=Clostridium thermarum TaxID=1716543 RepID=UPI0013D8951C|nr:dUTP diphosphatase [Clostridium thermarum]